MLRNSHRFKSHRRLTRLHVVYSRRNSSFSVLLLFRSWYHISFAFLLLTPFSYRAFVNPIVHFKYILQPAMFHCSVSGTLIFNVENDTIFRFQVLDLSSTIEIFLLKGSDWNSFRANQIHSDSFRNLFPRQSELIRINPKKVFNLAWCNSVKN